MLVWGCTSRQGYFGITVRSQVLAKRGHAAIGSVSFLRLCYQAQQERRWDYPYHSNLLQVS